MKTKGINVWEQYIEYIVLVIAIVVFAYFGWSTYTNQAIVVNDGKTITTTNVNEELINSGRTLSPKLDDSSPSPIDIVAPKELLSKFEQGIMASLSPNPRVVFPSVDLTADFAVNQDLVAELKLYTQPTIPSPEHIRTHQWFATIDESELDNIPELESVFAGPPHDATWIQVAAEFDIEGVIEQFKKIGEDASAIPEQWYDGVVDVFDLRLERETLGSDGWSAPELIKVMPGRLTFRPKLSQEQIDTVDRDNIVDQLQGGDQNQIIRPPFYAMKGYSPDQVRDPESWEQVTGIEDEEPTEPDSPIAALRNRIEEVSAEYSKREDTISELEEAINAAQRDNSGSSDGGPMGTDGAPRGGNADRIKELTRRLMLAMKERTDLARERDELIQELRMFDTEAADIIVESFGGKVWIWAHDLSVTPKSVYRYRISIQVANPFFGRKPSLYPEQQELADPVTLSSDTTPWSEPIEAQPPLQWFVLRAIEQGGSVTTSTIDSGRVSAEVYRFTDGSWHKDTFQVAAGQRLAAPDGGEFQTEWFVLDMIPWLDASEKNLRNHRANWVILQNMRTGVTEIVRPWEQSTSSRLKDLRLQERGSQYAEDPDLM